MQLPLFLFPPISLFSLALNSPNIFINPIQQYQKQHYFNRYYVQGPNKIQLLTIPIKKTSKPHPNLSEIQIFDNLWQKIHSRSLITAYNKSPYFEHYFPDIQPFFTNKYNDLYTLNFQIIKYLLKKLNIQPAQIIENQENEYALINNFDPTRKTLPSFFIPKSYTTTFAKFTPDLSILDLLFNCGPDTYNIIKESVQSKIDKNIC